LLNSTKVLYHRERFAFVLSSEDVSELMKGGADKEGEAALGAPGEKDGNASRSLAFRFAKRNQSVVQQQAPHEGEPVAGAPGRLTA